MHPDIYYLPIDNPALFRPDAVSVIRLSRLLPSFVEPFHL